MRENIGAKCYNGSVAAEIICKQNKLPMSNLSKVRKWVC